MGDVFGAVELDEVRAGRVAAGITLHADPPRHPRFEEEERSLVAADHVDPQVEAPLRERRHLRAGPEVAHRTAARLRRGRGELVVPRGGDGDDLVDVRVVREQIDGPRTDARREVRVGKHPVQRREERGAEQGVAQVVVAEDEDGTRGPAAGTRSQQRLRHAEGKIGDGTGEAHDRREEGRLSTKGHEGTLKEDKVGTVQPPNARDARTGRLFLFRVEGLSFFEMAAGRGVAEAAFAELTLLGHWTPGPRTELLSSAAP